MLHHKYHPGCRDQVVSVDVIIPMFNEQEVVSLLLERLAAVFCSSNRSKYGLSEVTYIFVDDGSQDATVPALVSRMPLENPAKIIVLSRNFGHQQAVTAGIMASDADVTAIIDADLQDPPELILDMINLWREGHDVVYGQRRTRQESVLKRSSYKAFYRLYRLMADVDVPLDTGDFCLMDKCVLKGMQGFREKVRFHRGLRSWLGFHQVGLPYDRPKRVLGQPKYDMRRLYKLATDGVASMSTRPLRLIQFLALLLFLISFVALFVFLVGSWTLGFQTALKILIVAQLLCGGMILLCQYILGAYVGRIYLEVKDRPLYITKREMTFPPAPH